MSKGLILYHNNMEDGEALFTKALLLRSGLDVVSASFDSLTIKTAYKQEVKADKLITDISLDDYNFLILPGGGYVFDIINDNKLDDIIYHFYNNNKTIGAICAAPMFLGKLSLLENKNYTSYPSTENDSFNGIYLKDLKVVKDRNIITARSAGSIYEFVFKLVETLLNDNQVEKLKDSIKY